MSLFNLQKLPNRLTVSRIILVFVFVALANIRDDIPGFFIPKADEMTARICQTVAYVVAILAALTDLFDGAIARKYHLESDFGKLMDPLADKIFIVGTFVMLGEFTIMPGWVIIIVLTREFMVTGLRMMALRKGMVIAADRWGKLKTAMQMTLLALGGLAHVLRFNLHQDLWWHIWMILLLIMVGLTVGSGIGYFVKNRDIYSDNL